MLASDGTLIRTSFNACAWACPIELANPVADAGLARDAGVLTRKGVLRTSHQPYE